MLSALRVFTVLIQSVRTQSCITHCECDDGTFVTCTGTPTFPTFVAPTIIETLFIRNSDLTTLAVDENTFPNLQTLRLRNCPSITCADVASINYDGLDVDTDFTCYFTTPSRGVTATDFDTSTASNSTWGEYGDTTTAAGTSEPQSATMTVINSTDAITARGDSDDQDDSDTIIIIAVVSVIGAFVILIIVVLIVAYVKMKHRNRVYPIELDDGNYIANPIYHSTPSNSTSSL